MSKRPANGPDGNESKRQRQDLQHNGIIFPTMGVFMPWVSSEIPSTLPSIPQILDKELEDTVFRHPGLSSGSNAPSYERLEWLGDAYLELFASGLIHETFKSTPSGRCSQVREILIRNTTLAQYFRDYGLGSKAQLPVDLKTEVSQGRGKSKDKDIVKIQADMFEAYVAAAIISDPENGLANTVSWLRLLWSRTIKQYILDNEKNCKVLPPGVTADQDKSSNLTAKEKLRAEIGAKGILIRYEDMPGIGKDKDLGMPLFTIGVYLDGWGEKNRLLATGTALKKQEAAHKAAARALENKRLLKTYKAKKAAFLEAVKAAEEEANNQPNTS